eukprot:TRINITY_DN1726_c0_g2_i1.p1 TRINITY_DN1726_c0_g2~~TRINITY_DN1726_c0_g2_i1.p1  ORF type:complete len:354 (-),score=47.65 TRINITY_DN1726_c0_g2_i1:221-1282(-)
MGICSSTNNEQARVSKIHDKKIEEEQQAKREEVKLLLLGTGESGKSTVFKQMKVIQVNGGFSNEDFQTYKFVVYGNCINQMKVVINAVSKLGLQYEDPNNKERAERLSDASSSGDEWTPEIGEDIKHLWADAAVKKTLEKRDELFQLNDSAEYFFNSIERINEPNFIPSVDDILRARVRSTGIEEATFKFNELTFRMVDVGGQRSERRKWIHCFEGSTAIVFCVGLSEYDQRLREEDTINRMEESLMLFEEICLSKYFRQTSIILFLNKLDLFQEKITRVPLTTCPAFTAFTGGSNFDSAISYVQNRFLEKDQQKSHQIFPHTTVAVSTENIKAIWTSVTETILRRILTSVSQ